MKALIFIREIFRKFPFLLMANTVLLVLVSLFGACSLLTVSPVVDFYIHPDLQGISPLTAKVMSILEFFKLPVTLKSWLIVFVTFVSLSSAFQVFARYSILKTKYAVLRDLMLGTFKDFFNAQWYFFSSGKQGTLINTFTRELNVVGNAFGAMALFFAGLLQMAFFLVVPFYLSWQVTLISLGVALLFALPFVLLGKYSYRLGILNTTTSNQLTAVIQESLNLAKVVLGFANQRRSVESLKIAFDQHCRATVKSQTLDIAIPRLYRPFGVIMIIVALFSAGRFNVPLSEIMVLLLALLQVAVSIGNLTTQKNALENFLPSYEQIKQLRQQAKQLKQKTGGRPFRGFTRELLVEKLSFAYPGQEPVLVDINVRIAKGRMVAFVGGSGVGKSTFIDMIIGFHQPTAGRITFDGVGLEDFDLNSYRRHLGYVPQESVLFNMSVRDNLRWAKEDATEEEIKQACKEANAIEFIEELPQGYDTVVGDRGVRLSGGQIQRVALTRAILRKPDILILDEATSSLDTHSERLIQEAIEKIAKETTVIVVAHRLSTVINADYIYVLKKGRVVEEGRYSELIRMGGEFHRMAKLQVLEAVS